MAVDGLTMSPCGSLGFRVFELRQQRYESRVDGHGGRVHSLLLLLASLQLRVELDHHMAL